ncbi:hypothetical protein H4219_004526 [Mycoemilia scoparia]|uniref:Uncharacterized protein n=1 Tax=Mycoemilia scoparia TaxID=417184 RepID=A0A9W8DMQ4_9FUNG|nr:hypothetical protein H4219_004526 [Mycoemilia scoparia]
MFKKSRSRNVRKKEVDNSLVIDEQESVEIIKRNPKKGPTNSSIKSSQQKSKLKSASSGLGVDSDDLKESESDEIVLKKSKNSLKLKEAAKLRSQHGNTESNDDDDNEDDDNEEEGGDSFPFGTSEGIPTKEQIVMAKKLREQRRMQAKQEEHDFIELSGKSRLIVSDDEDIVIEGMNNEFLLDPKRQERQNKKDIVDKHELVDEAEMDVEDPAHKKWEEDQIKNAGISLKGQDIKHTPVTAVKPIVTQRPELSYATARQRLEALLSAETEKYNDLQQQVENIKTEMEKSADSVEAINEQIAQTQQQLDHFKALAKNNTTLEHNILAGTQSLSLKEPPSSNTANDSNSNSNSNSNNDNKDSTGIE